MTTNLLIAFYTTYGHIHRMALAVAEGAESTFNAFLGRLFRWTIHHSAPLDQIGNWPIIAAA